MIAPDFKACQPTDLRPLQPFITKNHGDELWQTLAPSLNEITDTKKELCHAQQYACDVEQLEKMKDLFARNYQNAQLLNKYFPFGQGTGQVPVKFVWGDSFSKQVCSSSSAFFDALCSKYNYAVCLARIACYMTLEGDGIKYACKYMQQAAWVFDNLKTEVAGLKPGETGPDFTGEVLGMLAALCLA